MSSEDMDEMEMMEEGSGSSRAGIEEGPSSSPRAGRSRRRHPLPNMIRVQGADGRGLWVRPAIKEMADRDRMLLSQSNGQRFYGPIYPSLAGTFPTPRHGTEVFVARIPRNFSEVEIFPLFDRLGAVYQVRMMLDFSGANRGYCFVRFYKREDASKAVEQLHGYEIKKGCFINVSKSMDNCNLYISGIRTDKSNSEVCDEVMRVSEGITKIFLTGRDNQNILRDRGCLMIYGSHRAASMARRSFLNGTFKLWNRSCRVEWGPAEFSIRSLLVRNVPASITQQRLWELCLFGSNNEASRIRASWNGYLVDFRTQRGAEMAMKSICRMQIEGQNILGLFLKPGEPERLPPGRTSRTWRNRNEQLVSGSGNVDNSRQQPHQRSNNNNWSSRGSSSGRGRAHTVLPNGYQNRNNQTQLDQAPGPSSSQSLPQMRSQQYPPGIRHICPRQLALQALHHSMGNNLYVYPHPQSIYQHGPPLRINNYPANSSGVNSGPGNNGLIQNNGSREEEDYVDSFHSWAVLLERYRRYGNNGNPPINRSRLGWMDPVTWQFTHGGLPPPPGLFP